MPTTFCRLQVSDNRKDSRLTLLVFVLPLSIFKHPFTHVIAAGHNHVLSGELRNQFALVPQPNGHAPQ
jgi:hypothetical protein